MLRQNDAQKRPPVILKPIFVEVLPEFDAIKDGELWISPKYRTINLRCPCSCGELTVLSLHPSRWHIYFDGKAISLDGPTGGSVWAYSGCGSHYAIQNNAVMWLDRISPHRHSEYADVERARMLGTTSVRHSLRLRFGRVWRRLWSAMWGK